MPTTRREFLIGAAGAVGVIALGGAGAAQAWGMQPLLRPPGGQDEARLVGNCTMCYRCRSACPENVIVTAPLEDGLADMRTPKLDYTRGSCTFCGKCAEVCPTGSILSFDPNATVIGKAQVNREECIAYLQGGCQRCVDSCPVEGALAFDDKGRPVVNAGACNGCGVCEYVCPSASYGTYSGSRRRGITVEVAEGGAA